MQYSTDNSFDGHLKACVEMTYKYGRAGYIYGQPAYMCIVHAIFSFISK